MVDQINHHLYRKRGFYYFSRRVPNATGCDGVG